MVYSHQVQTGLALITSTMEVLLCTTGPVGLQVSYVYCSVRNKRVYVYIPCSSDHISNLEQTSEVVLTTPIWQLRGSGVVIDFAEGTEPLLPQALLSDAARFGLAIVQITPHRMQIDLFEKQSHRETIDFPASFLNWQ